VIWPSNASPGSVFLISRFTTSPVTPSSSFVYLAKLNASSIFSASGSTFLIILEDLTIYTVSPYFILSSSISAIISGDSAYYCSPYGVFI